MKLYFEKARGNTKKLDYLKFALLTSFALLFTACSVQPELPAAEEEPLTPAAINSIRVRVSARTDDAEETLSTGRMHLSSGQLELGATLTGDERITGLRFNEVEIPQGATITNAYIQFAADRWSRPETSLRIWGEADDNAHNFTSARHNISSRKRTDAAVSWSPEPWKEWRDAGPDQRTPDLTAVIQEVVNRSGWSSGNALAFILQGEGRRFAEAYDGESQDRAPLLYVEYSTGGEGNRSPSDPVNKSPQATTEADYYVAPWGSDRNSGTLEEPFATVEWALLSVRPGDVIQLRGGVYKQMVNTARNKYNGVASGTRDKPIIIESYPGEMAIFDGSNYKGRGYPSLFQLDNLDWYVVRNLTFRNSPGSGLDVQGDHNVIQNVLSHDNNGDGIYVVGSDILIEEVIAHSNYRIESGGNAGDGIKLVNGSDSVVRNSLVYNNSDDGLDAWNQRDTLIENVVSHHNGRGPRGNGNGFKLGGFKEEGSPRSGKVVRNCIAYGNRSWGFTYNGDGGITVLNSVAYDNSGGFVFRGYAHNVLRNNIAYANQDNILLDDGGRYGDGDPPTHDHNSWNLGISKPNFVSTDPDSSKFLALESSSPAIDRGRDVGLPYRGDAPDLGALEYGENVADLLFSDSGEQAFPFTLSTNKMAAF